MLDERKGVFLRASLFFVNLFRIRKTDLNLRLTMTILVKKPQWKFHDFSITQILGLINSGDSRSAKSAILTHLEALNFNSKNFCTF